MLIKTLDSESQLTTHWRNAVSVSSARKRVRHLSSNEPEVQTASLEGRFLHIARLLDQLLVEHDARRLEDTRNPCSKGTRKRKQPEESREKARNAFLFS